MAEKELSVVAGPNGAGKTTFAQEFLVERPMPYLSADAIASERFEDVATGDCSAISIQDEALYCRFLELVEGHRNAEY